MEDTRECECKYFEERFGHLTVNVLSNTCSEREGQSGGRILHSGPESWQPQNLFPVACLKCEFMSYHY